MSRVGKKPIDIPNGVEVKISTQGNHETVNVKGPKGALAVDLPMPIKISQQDQQLLLTLAKPDFKGGAALWGLARNLVNNLIEGVVKGFSKTLEINGVGFKVALQDKKLVLNVGFSHPVEYKIPEGINVEIEKNQIKIAGIDKQLVGQTAAEIRSIKKPEPYKGKGIKYLDETVRRKAGKVVKAA